MSTRLLRIGGICGSLAPVVTLTLIFISIRLSSWFSWHDNALSDLGVSATPNPFNAALLIGGALQLVFVIFGLRSMVGPGRLARVGLWAVSIGAIALPMIGIITEDYGRTHYYVAATYFVGTPLSYGLLGSSMIRHGDRIAGILSISAGIAAIVAITLVPHKRIAVPEILAATIMGAWTFAMGVKLLVEKPSYE
jgi:hypothetical membrane protein